MMVLMNSIKIWFILSCLLTLSCAFHTSHFRVQNGYSSSYKQLLRNQRDIVSTKNSSGKHVLNSAIPYNLALKNSIKNDDVIEVEKDEDFDVQSTLSLIGAQSVLVIVAIVAANFLNVPNNGLGDGFQIDSESIKSGVLATLPLFILAFVLDFVEKKVPALQDVTKATQRSVLLVLGGVRKPSIAIGVSMALGAAAGLGEEMLFRGVLQSELSEKFGDVAALTSASIIFGALHAVTPLYAFLASLASLYFGELYLQYHNLVVPIVCHGLYDVGALFAAHIQVNFEI